MRRPHSRSGTVAYQDLRRTAIDAQSAEVQGSVEARQVRGRTYLYEKRRIGTTVASRYIGEDTPALRESLERAATFAEDAAERKANRARLIRVLRAEGYLQTDQQTGALLSAFSNAGMFRLGGTVIGTAAFMHYEAELGWQFSRDDLAQTGDIDIASFERLSMVIEDKVSETPDSLLRAMKFDPVPSLDRGRVWRWKQAGKETMVEFLTPAFGDEGLRDLPALGVSAQALHYLNFLIADPIKAVALYRSGILVQIPRPEAYAIHKLIVADRRQGGPDALKSEKDRAQAAVLVEILSEDRPDELAESYLDARSRGPRWCARLDASLARMPQTAERLQQVTKA